jgi:hypothetical protein
MSAPPAFEAKFIARRYRNTMSKNRKSEPKPIPVRVNPLTVGEQPFVEQQERESSFRFRLDNLDLSVLPMLRHNEAVQLNLDHRPAYAETQDQRRIGDIRNEDVVTLHRLGRQTARIIHISFDPEPVCELEVRG